MPRGREVDYLATAKLALPSYGADRDPGGAGAEEPRAAPQQPPPGADGDRRSS